LPDLFESQVETNDFALPGDDELLGRPSDEATTQTETPEETPAEETVQTPPRDEQGRFASRQDEETPETPDPAEDQYSRPYPA